MVGRVLTVLETFHSQGPQLSLSEIVEACSIPKASAFRILETLRACGYLTRNPGERYRMTYKLLDVAMVVHAKNPLRRVALPYLEQLHKTFGETVNLGVRQEDYVVYVEILECRRRCSLVPLVGSHAPIHASALGKAIGAWLPQEELRQLISRTGLRRFTNSTITTEDALRDELACTRERGYAIDQAEEEPGSYCVAVPIYRPRNQLVCAISVSAPIDRMSGERVARFGQILTVASREITAQLS